MIFTTDTTIHNIYHQLKSAKKLLKKLKPLIGKFVNNHQVIIDEAGNILLVFFTVDFPFRNYKFNDGLEFSFNSAVKRKYYFPNDDDEYDVSNHFTENQKKVIKGFFQNA
jgi:hypothetical protein